MLELKNIVKVYETGDTSVTALKDVSIKFSKNEFVSILGPSGCGKTTLLNIVGGLDRYTEGDLIINDKSTKDFKSRDWDTYRNHSIGFVFQSYNLISHQSVEQNVEMALTLSGISKKERKARAIEVLKSVGLENQIKKKPNQLSGGQMQRVAIARALVNNPDIILADEPTGALDSETSIQIMELLREVAKTRLVIMVTHNPDLAYQYSTRIIRLKDGEVIKDEVNTPKEDAVIEEAPIIPATSLDEKKKSTSMSFFTALSLSFKNLLTKKTRTILTSFAGSIGIIGISLILAMSNGFQNYIDKMQRDTLSNYPLTISRTSIDYDAVQSELMNSSSLERYPEGDKIYVSDITSRIQNMTMTNNITKEYIKEVIETVDPKDCYSVGYGYDVSLNAYIPSSFTVSGALTEVQIQASSTLDSSEEGFMTQMMTSMMMSTWGEVPDSNELVSSQYDILDEGGHFPTSANEFVIVVNRYNQISNLTLQQLGLTSLAYELDENGQPKIRESFTFEELKEQASYYIVNNDDLYSYNETSKTYAKKTINLTDVDESQSLKLVGIVRLNQDTDSGAIGSTVGYHSDFVKTFIDAQMNSEIVKAQEAADYNVLTGNVLVPIVDAGDVITIEEQRQLLVNSLGGNDVPDSISLYPRDFNAKNRIKEHLDAYNVDKADSDKIRYSDTTELMVSSMNTAINSISYVLIAFTSVSLVVSSIMIGIITYISVIERTKEIGILRSIGARKKDISRVFTAETLIIGFTAGLIGVLSTYILSIPINMILLSLVEVDGIASLHPLHALVLIIISMLLTVISGIFPSRIAAKRDPVVALRSE